MSPPNSDQFRIFLVDYSQQYLALSIAQVHKISTSTFAFIILTICIPPLIALIFYEAEAAKARLKLPQGCRKLGLKIESNLANEFEKKFSQGRPASTVRTSDECWRVKVLAVYPIKSCKGVELNRSTVINTGMEYDRQFTFAQLKTKPPKEKKAAHEWKFITQREYPLLARIKTEMWVPDQSVRGYESDAEDVQSSGVIVLSFPYQQPGWKGKLEKWGAAVKRTVPEIHFRIPFDPTPGQVENAGYKYEDIKIWKDKVRALNMELEIPKELRYFLGISNKLGLFRVDNGALREVHRCAPTKGELRWQPVIGFQDAYPLHILNLASVRDLELYMRKGSPRLSAARFRANIIITGPEAYNEDSWKRVRIGYYDYAVSCRTARCKLPNIDQVTGERHPVEPDRALRGFRNIDLGAGNNVGCLGMQLVPIVEEGLIRVGDEVTVQETGEHFYINQ